MNAHFGHLPHRAEGYPAPWGEPVQLTDTEKHRLVDSPAISGDPWRVCRSALERELWRRSDGAVQMDVAIPASTWGRRYSELAERLEGATGKFSRLIQALAMLGNDEIREIACAGKDISWAVFVTADCADVIGAVAHSSVSSYIPPSDTEIHEETSNPNVLRTIPLDIASPAVVHHMGPDAQAYAVVLSNARGEQVELRFMEVSVVLGPDHDSPHVVGLDECASTRGQKWFLFRSEGADAARWGLRGTAVTVIKTQSVATDDV